MLATTSSRVHFLPQPAPPRCVMCSCRLSRSGFVIHVTRASSMTFPLQSSDVERMRPSGDAARHEKLDEIRRSEKLDSARLCECKGGLVHAQPGPLRCHDEQAEQRLTFGVVASRRVGVEHSEIDSL